MERSRWCPLKCLANFSRSKVHSLDQDPRKYKGGNVPLASADVLEKGRLCDKPNESMHRRLDDKGSGGK